MAPRDEVVRAVDDHETTTGQLRQPVGAGDRLAVIVRAVNDEQRTAHVAADCLDRLERPGILDAAVGDHRVHGSVERPAHDVLEDLGGVGLGGQLAEEEPDEAGIVAAPVMLVELRPALVGLQFVMERRTARATDVVA